MEPIVGDEVLFLRHILSSKALQPLLALVSYETDEEQCRAFESLQVTINLSIDSLQVNI
jgi:hypothetical protein